MLQLTCPYCGPRAESEFAYGGEGLSTSSSIWPTALAMTVSRCMYASLERRSISSSGNTARVAGAGSMQSVTP